MPPAMVIDLVRLLEDGINQQGASNIPVHLQVLCALRFFAKGAFQKGAAQDFQHPLGQSTFSKCLGKMVNALNVQAICGANKLVYNIRICPGSNND